MNQTATAATLLLILAASTASAFYPTSPHSLMGRCGGGGTGINRVSIGGAVLLHLGQQHARNTMQLLSSPNNDFDSDFPPPKDNDETNNGVDWDAEWKKVVANKDQPKQRPGQDFYKSDAEIVVTKTVNRSIETVQKQVAAAKKDLLPSITNTAALTNDWRFWIAILAFVSVATAVLTAPPQLPVDQSYYI
jgi:hypothetical protein